MLPTIDPPGTSKNSKSVPGNVDSSSARACATDFPDNCWTLSAVTIGGLFGSGTLIPSSEYSASGFARSALASGVYAGFSAGLRPPVAVGKPEVMTRSISESV